MILIDHALGASTLLQGTTSTAASRSQRVLIVGLLGVVACVLTGIHVFAVHMGQHWTSPLLLGDHLFDLGFALAILWYALALGIKIRGPLYRPDDDPLSSNLVAIGLGLGCMSTAILFLGFLRLYYAPVFLTAAIALTLILRHNLDQTLFRAVAAGKRWVRSGMPVAPTLGLRLLLLLCIGSLIMLLIDATVPVGAGSPVEVDALIYHLTGPKLFMQAHAMVALPDIPLANAPLGLEMFYIPGLLAQSDGVGKMLSVLMAVLFCLATFSVCRRTFGAKAAWWSVVLLCNVSWVQVEIPSNFGDYAAFFFFMLAVGDIITWCGVSAVSNPSPKHRPRVWLALNGGDWLLIRGSVLFGLSCSFKLVNLPGLAAIVAGVGLIALVTSPTGFGMRLVVAVRAGLIAGAVSLIVVSPWLLKSIYYFGHPLIFSVPSSDSSNAVGAVVSGLVQGSGQGQVTRIVTDFIRLFIQNGSPFIALLAAVPLLLRTAVGRGACLLFFLIAGVWLYFVPQYTYSRYFIGVIALALILSAAVLIAIMERLPRRAHLIELVLMLYLVPNTLLVVSVNTTMTLRNGGVEAAVGSISRSTYLSNHVRVFAAENWINSNTPPDARVAVVGTSSSYYLDRPILADYYRARYQRLLGNGAMRSNELTTWCHASVKYVLLDLAVDGLDPSMNVRTVTPNSLPWLDAFASSPRELYSAHGMAVFSVDPCALKLLPG